MTSTPFASLLKLVTIAELLSVVHSPPDIDGHIVENSVSAVFFSFCFGRETQFNMP
jgi:hypothetical protein